MLKLCIRRLLSRKGSLWQVTEREGVRPKMRDICSILVCTPGSHHICSY